MFEVNWLAALVAAALAFVLGGVWYSPLVFGKRWCAEIQRDMDTPHPPYVFAIAFVHSLIGAVVFAGVVGPAPALLDAIHWALMLSIGLVATSFGINYQFGGRSFTLWGIDAGYHICQYLLYAFVLALWP